MAAIDENLLNHLILSIDVVYCNSSSLQQKKEALKVCEDFQKMDDIKYLYCMELMKKNDFNLVYFGANLLSIDVKAKWNTFSTQFKENIKESFFEKISHFSLDSPLFVKDCFAKCIASICKFEWPSNWSGLFNSFIDHGKEKVIYLEVFCYVLARLLEDVIYFQNMKSLKRQNEVKAGLIERQNEILNILREILLTFSKSYESCVEAGEKSLLEASLKIALTTVQCYVGWWILSVPLLSFLSDVIFPFVKDEVFRSAALPIFTDLLDKKKNRKAFEKDLLASFIVLPAFSIEMLMLCRNVFVEASSVQKEYDFTKQAAEYFMIYTLSASSHALGFKDEPFKDNFSELLECLLALNLHPSQTISCLGLQICENVLKSCSINLLQLQPFLEVFFLNCLPRMSRYGKHELASFSIPDTEKVVPFIQQDFIDESEYITFMNNVYRPACRSLILVLLQTHPLYIFNFILTFYKKGFDIAISASPPLLYVLEVLPIFSSSLSNYISSADKSSTLPQNVDELKNEAIAFIRAFVDQSFDNRSFQSKILSCVYSLTYFLNFSPETLKLFYAKLLNEVIFYMDKIWMPANCVVDSPVNFELLEFVRHCTSILINLSKDFAPFLSQHYPELHTIIYNILESPSLSPVLKETFFECNILLISSLSDASTKEELLKNSLASLFYFWRSEEFCSALNSVPEFLIFIEKEIDNSTELFKISKTHKLVFVILALKSIFKRAPRIIIPNIKEVILPNLFRLIKIIVDSYSQNSISTYNENLKEAFFLSKQDICVNLTLMTHQMELNDKYPSIKSEKYKNFRRHYRTICENVVIFFSHILPHLESIAQVEDMSSVLQFQNSFALAIQNFSSIPLHFVKAFVHPLISHLAKKCPYEFVPASFYILHLGKRISILSSSFSSIFENIGKDEVYKHDVITGESKEINEILFQNLCGFILRDYIDFLYLVLIERTPDQQLLESDSLNNKAVVFCAHGIKLIENEELFSVITTVLECSVISYQVGSIKKTFDLIKALMNYVFLKFNEQMKVSPLFLQAIKSIFNICLISLCKMESEQYGECLRLLCAIYVLFSPKNSLLSTSAIFLFESYPLITDERLLPLKEAALIFDKENAGNEKEFTSIVIPKHIQDMFKNLINENSEERKGGLEKSKCMPLKTDLNNHIKYITKNMAKLNSITEDDAYDLRSLF